MAGILILYEPLSDDLRGVIDEDAQKRDVSPYDVVRMILADRYKMTAEPTGPYRPAGERFKLRVSPRLRNSINLEAAKNGATIRGIVLSTLATHYGLAPIDTGRRPRSTA